MFDQNWADTLAVSIKVGHFTIQSNIATGTSQLDWYLVLVFFMLFTLVCSFVVYAKVK